MAMVMKYKGVYLEALICSNCSTL